MTERDTLVERLRATRLEPLGAKELLTALPVNPDGDEAAERIETQAAEIERLSSVRGDVVEECAKVVEARLLVYEREDAALARRLGIPTEFKILAAALRALAGPEAAAESERLSSVRVDVVEEWQDIASAPRDGRAVHLGFAHMAGFDVIAHWDSGGWSLTGEGRHAVRLHGRPPPTHWHPLPDPPAIRAPTGPDGADGEG